MVARRILLCAGATAVFSFVFVGGGASATVPSTRAVPGGGSAWVLTAGSTGSTYAPTFTGNGVLGVRVPPNGQGYAGGTVPAQSELAGFYAQPAGDVQQRANIPTWSTLLFSDSGQEFSAHGAQTSRWRQSIDLRTGAVTTTARWTAADGHVTDLAYTVLTDRARPSVGLVRLTVIPRWSGTATVTDLIDGTAANHTSQVDKGWVPAARRDWVTVKTEGTNIVATLASQLGLTGIGGVTDTPVDQSTNQSVGQRLDFPVSAGHSYTVTKYVGVVSSQSGSGTADIAQSQAASAASTGWNALLAANNSAWNTLWAGRVDVVGSPTLAKMVRASEFYLWSSTRDGVNWSVSPAGLSSNGYDGHIFWDAETWMFPSLLAFHPDLAAAMNAYRYARLSAAQQHAAATGYKGARYPWESALDGTEQIPPPVSKNSEGLFEQHITADIALAQWQYYVDTGDRRWLQQRGWPVLSKAATFWASRAVRGSDGKYHIRRVTGPDEENPNVNDEAYTNVGARATLLDAASAARVLGLRAPEAWTQVARSLAVLRTGGIHPEFSGYRGQLVKQADVTLLQYPWAYPMSKRTAAADINYYVPRTDPGGPSMSDAVNEIDTSALRTPGCSSYVYTERSFQPFIKDVFDQFSETRNGGAFTFMTGIGGFLQEFTYGYSGLRFGTSLVSLAPSLTRQLPGVVLHGVSWHGRRFTVSIGQRVTRVTLQSGAPLPLRTPGGRRLLSRAHPVTLTTARPDLAPAKDTVRCGVASASSAQPGAPALAAVDGSPATDWQPAALPATLRVTAGGRRQRVRTATLRWGRHWPPAPGPNIPPPPGPVATLRPSRYVLQVSGNGRSWRTVATVARSTGTVDVVRFRATAVKFVRVRIVSGGTRVTMANPNGPGTVTGTELPMLDELTVSG
jgi:trehalose/maltose hydrolase-like predicted phosphorylase